jgi:endoglucanase
VWSIKLAIDGSMTDMWNAKAEGTTGTVTVTGVEWNASLEPQASASFGFCASL